MNMYLSKSLLLNEQSYEHLRASYENLPEVENYTESTPHTAWHLSKPEKYPCVCVFTHYEDNSGPNYYDGDYVYLSDFEDNND